MFAIGEIYFPWGKRPCHQICLYYNVHLADDSIPLAGVFHGYDELDNERIDLDFCWVPLDELKNGAKVYPLELILILSILVYTFFSRMFDLMQPLVVKYSIAVA